MENNNKAKKYGFRALLAALATTIAIPAVSNEISNINDSKARKSICKEINNKFGSNLNEELWKDNIFTAPDSVISKCTLSNENDIEHFKIKYIIRIITKILKL